MSARNERGTALIMTLIFSITFAGLASFLLMRVRTEAKFQKSRNDRIKAFNIAMGGISAAMVKVGNSSYTAGPSGDRNAVLYNADSTEDSTPGSKIIDDGTYDVQVNNLGYLWYELVSISTAGEDTREIKLRVREKDYFSKFSLYAENADVVVDDTNRWHGDIHVNEELRFRNRISGTYAKFYGKATSCKNPTNYVESGGYEETLSSGGFIGGTDFNQGEDGKIELPEATELTAIGTIARTGASKLSFGSPYDESQHGSVWQGANGISIEDGSLNGMKTYVTFSDSDINRRQMNVVRKTSGGTVVFNHTFTLPLDGVVHVEGDINGVKGDINSRTTLVSETGRVDISDDIVYVDNSGRPVYIYDDDNPGVEGNFVMNPDYMDGETTPPRVLAIMAKEDIFFLNQDGHASGDIDLCVSAILASGVGGADADGGIRWLYPTESGHEGINQDTPMRDLRLMGAMIADGTSYGWAHWKGTSSGGFTNSVYFYDYNVKANHPPHFLEIETPLYSGLEIVR